MTKKWQKALDELCCGDVELQRELKTFSFNEHVVVTGTKPLLFELNGDIFDVPLQTWRSLYIIFVATLYANKMYADKETQSAVKSVVRWSSKGEYLHSSPQKISRSFFIETKLSALQIHNQIKNILELCDIPLEKMRVAYLGKDVLVHEKTANTTIELNKNIVPNSAPSDLIIEKPTLAKHEIVQKIIAEDLFENKSISLQEGRQPRQKYLFNGVALCKGPTVYAVIEYYVRTHLGVSFAELQGVFPDDAARPGFAKMLRREEDVSLDDWNGRRFNKQMIVLSDGTKVAVSTQWTPANFENFCKYARRAGLIIEELDPNEGSVTRSQKQKSSQSDILLASYKKVLIEKFSSGYILDNIIQRNRFRHFYEELNGSQLDSSDMELDNTIEMCGMVHDGRLYVIENLLEESIKLKLLEYIEDQLNLHPRLYLETLFECFADDFRGTAIESMDILKTYLQALPGFNYYINKDRVFRDESFRYVGRPRDEVKRLLEEEHRPMSDDEIFKKLDWIPQEKIGVAFMQCSVTQEILSNGDHSRFILETFDIAGDEIEWLSEWIKSELDNSDFIGSMDAVKALKNRYSDIAERNSGFRDIGIRNAIAVLLGDDFDFKGNLIVKKGKIISNEDLFKDFCESRDAFTVDDIDILANSLGVPALYDVIYGNSFRLNERDFVQRVPKMDIDAIDDVIETFVRDKEFIPLKKIDFWGGFPIVSGNWNHFMLESFLWRCSKKFKLVHSNFSKTTYAGAIVRNNVVMDFEDVLVHALSEGNFDAGRAKKFLKEEGFLAREKCSNIDSLLEKSQQLRTSRK